MVYAHYVHTSTHICENEKKSAWPTLVHPGIPEPGLVSLELLLAFRLTHHTETLWQSILDHSYNSCGNLMNTLIRVIFWKSINAMGEAVRLFMSGFDTININLLTKLGRYTKHMPHRHTQTQLSFPKSIFHVKIWLRLTWRPYMISKLNIVLSQNMTHF